VVPYLENGKIRGVKITYIRRGTFISTLGLQKNDVIKSIDGRRIKNAAEGMELYDSLTKRDRVRLEIVRDGRTFNQDFRIK
jgi:general secretion pathway protein C